MTNPWTFSCGSFTDATPESAQLQNIRLVTRSQAPDILSFSSPRASCLAANPFTYDAPFTLKRAGVRFFTGRIATLPVQGNYREESLSWQVVGPWRFLEECVYHQVWYKRTEASPDDNVEQLLSHCILGQSLTAGVRLDTSEVISDVLTFLLSKIPSALTVGDLPVGINMPFEEVTDITCAEAIKRMLRWHPHAVSWFDYSAEVPVLHIRDRASLSALSVNVLSGDILSDIAITPRYDLVPDGVIVTFERSDVLTGGGGQVEARVTTEQIAPEGVVRGDRRVLCFTVELQGQRGSVLRQELGTVTLPANLNDKTWWKSHLPSLNPLNVADFTIVNAERLFDGGWPEEGDPALNEEVTIGAVPDWYSDKHVGKDVVRARLLVLTRDKNGNAVLKVNKLIAVKILVTDLEGEITPRGEGGGLAARDGLDRDCGELFEHVVVDEYPEPEPADLAADLYAILSVLHYQGAIVLQYDELTAAAHVGQVLNLTNGVAAWATMNALIQSCAYDLEQGTVSVEFGPPSHLSLSDMVSLLRSNRVRRIPPPGEHRSRPQRGGPAWENLDQQQAAQGAADQLAEQVRKMIVGAPVGEFYDSETVGNTIELDPELITTLHKVLTVTDAGDGKFKAEFNWVRAHA